MHSGIESRIESKQVLVEMSRGKYYVSQVVNFNNRKFNIDKSRIIIELKERSFDPRTRQPINFGNGKFWLIKRFLKITTSIAFHNLKIMI